MYNVLRVSSIDIQVEVLTDMGVVAFCLLFVPFTYIICVFLKYVRNLQVQSYVIYGNVAYIAAGDSRKILKQSCAVR